MMANQQTLARRPAVELRAGLDDSPRISREQLVGRLNDDLAREYLG